MGPARASALRNFRWSWRCSYSAGQRIFSAIYILRCKHIRLFLKSPWGFRCPALRREVLRRASNGKESQPTRYPLFHHGVALRGFRGINIQLSILSEEGTTQSELPILGCCVQTDSVLKVDNFDFSTVRNHDVARLDVPMGDLKLVQLVEPQEDLSKDDAHLVHFRARPNCDGFQTFPSQFHEQNSVLFSLKIVRVSGDIRAVDCLQHPRLIPAFESNLPELFNCLWAEPLENDLSRVFVLREMCMHNVGLAVPTDEGSFVDLVLSYFEHRSNIYAQALYQIYKCSAAQLCDRKSLRRRRVLEAISHRHSPARSTLQLKRQAPELNAFSRKDTLRILGLNLKFIGISPLRLIRLQISLVEIKEQSLFLRWRGEFVTLCYMLLYQRLKLLACHPVVEKVVPNELLLHLIRVWSVFVREIDQRSPVRGKSIQQAPYRDTDPLYRVKYITILFQGLWPLNAQQMFVKPGSSMKLNRLYLNSLKESSMMFRAAIFLIYLSARTYLCAAFRRYQRESDLQNLKCLGSSSGSGFRVSTIIINQVYEVEHKREQCRGVQGVNYETNNSNASNPYCLSMRLCCKTIQP